MFEEIAAAPLPLVLRHRYQQHETYQNQKTRRASSLAVRSPACQARVCQDTPFSNVPKEYIIFYIITFDDFLMF
jgi:hypothetical protein